MAKVETIILGTEDEDIAIGAEIIRRGGLVAFPTETVYGLGANGLDAEAAAKIYEAKGRPSDNPMILHICAKEDLAALAENITDEMRILMDCFWPGPMTMVVRARDIIPKVTTGGLDTVAVRMPQSPVALKLIRAAGVPLAAPSANISGRPSPTSGIHVLDDLNGKIDAVIMGDDCRIGIESTVIDMTGSVPVILRPGLLTPEDFSMALNEEVKLDDSLLRDTGPRDGSDSSSEGGNFRPKSPGMKYRHYAPKAEMVIFSGAAEKVRQTIAEQKMLRESQGQKVGVIIYDNDDAVTAAHEFFARLRAMDKAGVDVIFAAALKEDGIGFALMNRMRKSAGYNIIEV